LIITAMRRSVLTYGEAGEAIGLDGVALPDKVYRVLDDFSASCIEAEEPSLAALVVNAETGEPAQGGRRAGCAGVPKCSKSFFAGLAGNATLQRGR